MHLHVSALPAITHSVTSAPAELYALRCLSLNAYLLQLHDTMAHCQASPCHIFFGCGP